MNSTLSDIARTSGNLVQAKHGDEWVAIQVGEGMPPPVIMPMNPSDPGYAEWKREVQSFCIISRKPEHKHIPFPEPREQFPSPKDRVAIPLRTHCVFWYRGLHIILDAVELFEISMRGPAISEILQRLKQGGSA